MIGYYVPHRLYPADYHCDPKQPLPFASLASQKNHMASHLMCSTRRRSRGMVPGSVARNREETRHGQVLHPVQKAGRSDAGCNRPGDKAHAGEMDQVLQGARG